MKGLATMAIAKLKSGLSIRIWNMYQEALFSFKSENARSEFRAAILQDYAARWPNSFMAAVDAATKQTESKDSLEQ
jgi:hypothetical protein